MIDLPSESELLQLLWRIKDNVLARTGSVASTPACLPAIRPSCRSCYSENPALRAETQRTIIALAPAFRALLGDGPDIQISSDLVAQVQQLANALAQNASPDLRSDIRQAWAHAQAERLVGLRVTEAWAAVGGHPRFICR